MRSLRALLPMLVFLAALLVGCQPAPAPADFAVTNGILYTVDAERSVAQAMAVRDGAIVYVGDDAGAKDFVGAETDVVDLQGRLVLPEFVDSHAHATSGVSELCEVPLYGLGSAEEYQQALRDFLAANPDVQALQGGGWINAVFSPHGPTADLLDGVAPAIPVVLGSEDYHSLWVNSKALELAGLTADTPDPEGAPSDATQTVPDPGH